MRQFFCGGSSPPCTTEFTLKPHEDVNDSPAYAAQKHERLTGDYGMPRKSRVCMKVIFNHL
jgi:hypothetical protein